MPTSKDSPTAGEVAQNDVPKSTDPHIFEEGVETNFPDTVPEDVLEEGNEEPVAQAGEVWAVWNGLQPGERILTVADLNTLGDKDAEEPLVWDRDNRFRREVSGVHPMVLDYLENLDDMFAVVRYE